MSACFDKSPLGVYHMEGNESIPQGADWDVNIKYKEDNSIVDLSSYTGRMQIRLGYNKAIILELTTDNGGILVGSGAGDTPNVILKFTPARTSPISTYEGMIYDLELTSATNKVLKFLEGRFEIRPEVTK